MTKDREVLSLTKDLKSFLATEAGEKPVSGNKLIPILDSIYNLSANEGLTLQEFVSKYQEEAVRKAEAVVAGWSNVLTEAALQGTCTLDSGEVCRINKNTVKMIEQHYNASKEDLAVVNAYLMTCAKSGDTRKDILLRTLYKRGVYNGDTRALLYMIDRVEGRPSESKKVENDYSNAYNVYQIVHSLFDKQLEVLNTGPGTKIVMCSRRSGKTHLAVAMCLISALSKKNTFCLYIGKTMHDSERLFDSAANQMIDECQLKDSEGNRLNWKRLENGSEIIIRGLSNTKDPDQIRGLKAEVIVLDEFFHLKSDLLGYMHREVLGPMQMDYASSYKMLMIGTPPKIRKTYGEKVWSTWDIPHFTWTFRDNPYPEGEDKEAYVDNVLREMGLDRTSSFYLREYCAQNVYEEDALLYPDFHTYDPIDMPHLHIDHVYCGIDYGNSDNTAIVGIAWDATEQRGYVFFERKFNRLTVGLDQSPVQVLKEEVKALWGMAMDFFPSHSPKEANKRIIWTGDNGGSDQMLQQDMLLTLHLERDKELRMQWGVPHKTDKVFMFDKIRELLRKADLLLPKDGLTEQECEMTILLQGPNGQILPEVDDRTFHPDILPAMRYALWYAIGRPSSKD
ncbi:MAG: hypothetical protein Pg6A_20170 [Termitinemataceae bacterium]|nr:MAG: hypothetical protein Pg6A_20170 [Termitinemataceae bacterium]